MLELPTKTVWKGHIKSLLYLMVGDRVEAAASRMPSLSDVQRLHSPLDGHPLKIISCFRGDVTLARLNLFRVRLLLHCANLSEDTAIFHPRINRTRDPTCPLCGQENESTRHFICSCPALQHVRQSWWDRLPFSGASLYSHVMGIIWTDAQCDIVQFLAALRSRRQSQIV